MVADDLAALPRTRARLQSLICEAQSDECRERYRYSVTKTRVQVVDEKKGVTIKPVYLNGVPLQTSKQEGHVGIERRANDCNTSITISRIKLPRRKAYYVPKQVGLCGRNGTGP